MTAVKPGDVERTLRRIDPAIDVALVYGPDAGLVAERSARIASHRIVDVRDPFQLIRLDGDVVAERPERLVEEISTFSMFAGPRVVLVRPTARNLTPAVAACLAVSSTGTLVIVEAGNLTRSSPLRTACEASRRALALPCFGDESRELVAVIDETMSQAGLSITPDARLLLLENVGADRLATRSELSKLVLYAHGQGSVTVEHVEAVVSDVSAQSGDAVLDSAFLGRIGELDGHISAMSGRGWVPASVLANGLRHALTLLDSRLSIEDGEDVEAAVRALRPVHFRRQDLVKRQLRVWRSADLRWATDVFQTASLDTRRTASIASAIASTALLRIARRAAAASAR